MSWRGRGVPERAGLWRAVLQRSRADWPVVLAAWLLLVCATSLLAAGAIYGDTVARSGLQHALDDAPPAARAILVRTAARTADAPGLEATVRAELQRTLAPAEGEVALIVHAGAFTLADGGGTGGSPTTGSSPQRLISLGAYEGLERHATLLAGSWPAPGHDPRQVALSEGAARTLGLVPGQRLTLMSQLSPQDTVAVEVAGIWQPAPDDPYWLGDPLELDGRLTVGDTTTLGPLMLATDDVGGLGLRQKLDLEWRDLFATRTIEPDDVDALRQRLAGLSGRLLADLPPAQGFTVTTTLPDRLAAVARSVLVSRSGVTILTIQFAVLATYAVLLVAAMLLERRRAEVALLRSRGASSRHLAALAAGEAVLLALPAVLVAPFLGVVVVRLVGSIGPLADAGIAADATLSPGAWVAALLAGAACVVGLTLPALTAGASPALVRTALGRPLGRTLPQRVGIDLALLVLAAVALWQLRLYGAPLTRDARGVLGLDPLLVAAPAIGLLAGAVVATRFVPRLAEIAERFFARGQGLVGALSARQLARRPLRYTRSALLLMLAVALGTFATAYAATWLGSQQDQARYQAAGDIRAISAAHGGPPPWAVGSGYRSLAGVRQAQPVVVQSLEVGGPVRGGQLLALDLTPGTSLGSGPGTGSAAGAPSVDLGAARPSPPAIPLPGRPQRLAIMLDADLGVAPEMPGPPVDQVEGATVAVALVLVDADGVQRIEAGDAAFEGDGQRLEVPLTEAIEGQTLGPAYPLRLEAIEFTLSGPSGLPIGGRLQLRALELSDTATGDAWQPLAFDPAAPGWAWDRIRDEAPEPYVPPADSPGALVLAGEVGGGRAVVSDPPGDSETIFRLWAAFDAPPALPALVGTSFLELTGARLGDTVQDSSAGYALPLHLLAAAASFAPLDPSVPFAVVDGRSLGYLDYAAFDRILTPQEWWLSADDASAGAILQALAKPPYQVAQAIGRADLARSLAADPVPLGMIGALILGVLAALAMATLGFLVSATVSASERLGEFALLRALGLSARGLTASLTLEYVYQLTVGLVAGSALGLLLAWLVLPSATFTPTGLAAVPTPTIDVPWGAIALADLVLGLILILAAQLVTRRVPDAGLGGLLRARDE
ncbi:MAG: FtsX-like permease family protein [Candidatus Limnocylindrales bacterium]